MVILQSKMKKVVLRLLRREKLQFELRKFDSQKIVSSEEKSF